MALTILTIFTHTGEHDDVHSETGAVMTRIAVRAVTGREILAVRTETEISGSILTTGLDQHNFPNH